MNHRPIPTGLSTVLFEQILSKMSKASGKDAFYVSMALGRGLGRKLDESQIPAYSDICYGLYVQVMRHIKEYDL